MSFLKKATVLSLISLVGISSAMATTFPSMICFRKDVRVESNISYVALFGKKPTTNNPAPEVVLSSAKPYSPAYIEFVGNDGAMSNSKATVTYPLIEGRYQKAITYTFQTISTSKRTDQPIEGIDLIVPANTDFEGKFLLKATYFYETKSGREETKMLCEENRTNVVHPMPAVTGHN